jgi:hypothetical protein
MYGKAGAFRPKTYGVEYRSLSNKWIFDNKLVDIVYKLTETAVDKFFLGQDAQEEVEDVINSGDKGHKYIFSSYSDIPPLLLKYGLT